MRAVQPPLVKVSNEAPTSITGFDEITGGSLPCGNTPLLVNDNIISSQMQTVLDTLRLQVIVK